MEKKISVVEASSSFDFDKFNSGADFNSILNYKNRDQFLQIGYGSQIYFGCYIGSYWEYIDKSLKYIGPGMTETFTFSYGYGVTTEISVTESISTEIDIAPFGMGTKVSCELSMSQSISNSETQTFSVSYSVTGEVYQVGFQQITVVYCPKNYYENAKKDITDFKTLLPGKEKNDYIFIGIRNDSKLCTTVPSDFKPEVSFDIVIDKLYPFISSNDWLLPISTIVPTNNIYIQNLYNNEILFNKDNAWLDPKDKSGTNPRTNHRFIHDQIDNENIPTYKIEMVSYPNWHLFGLSNGVVNVSADKESSDHDQHWYVQMIKKDTYVIRNYANKKYLARQYDKNWCQMQNYNPNSMYQQWTFTPCFL